MKADPKPAPGYNRLRLYGLTADQWLALIKDGRCPLCQKRYSSSRRPVVEHDHRSGLVRGSCCVACNYRIGTLHDDTGWLSRAADYLQTPPAIALIGEVYVPGSPPTLG